MKRQIRSVGTNWLLGFIHSIFLSFFFSIALANVLVQITWLDMRADLGGLVPVFMLLAAVLYLLNTWLQLDNWLVWEWKWMSWVILLAGSIAILVMNGFEWSHLSIVPAALIRDGLGLSGMSLRDINKGLTGFLLLGAAVQAFYRKRIREGKREVSKKRKNQILIVLAASFVFGLLYVVQPGVRYFIHDASAMLAKADIQAFRDYLLSFGIWAPVVSALLMVFQSLVAPLPAFVITFANGMLFGAFWGGLLSWSSAMVGAALCFLIARILGRPVVERLVSKTALHWTDQFFSRYGKHSILVARLLPIVSFDIVSYGAGLTSMGFWGFWIATGVGQAPATILYSYLGQTASGSVKFLFWIFILTICAGVILSAWKAQKSSREGKGQQPASHS